MWISVWITFNNNSNDYYYCFRTSQRLCFMPICIRPVPLTPASSLLIIQLVDPTCKNVQYPSYTKKHTIILYYYCMFQYGGVFTLYLIGALPQGGDVFNSHANFKIVSSFHTIHQITPNSLR